MAVKITKRYFWHLLMPDGRLLDAEFAISSRTTISLNYPDGYETEEDALSELADYRERYGRCIDGCLVLTPVYTARD